VARVEREKKMKEEKGLMSLTKRRVQAPSW
jgi:hypothetical protein